MGNDAKNKMGNGVFTSLHMLYMLFIKHYLNLEKEEE